MNKDIKMPAYADIIGKAYSPYRCADDNEQYNKVQVPDITFQVTDGCNLRCTYCYQKQKGTHIMSFDVAKKFIDLLLENNESTKQYLDTWCCDAIILNFIGGEPFLAIDLIDQITNYFIKRTMEVNHPWAYNYCILITTNGTLYFQPKVQAYLKKHLKHLSMTVSIDGNKQLHDSCRIYPNGEGSYDQAIAAAKHFRDVLGGTLGNKMTLSPNNIQYTYDGIISFINNGFTDIFLNCVFEKGWTIEHAKILYKELKRISDYALSNDLANKLYISMYDNIIFAPIDKENDKDNYCGGNGRMLAVDWKGDIYPCVRFMESSLTGLQPPIIVGNVEQGFGYNEKCKTCIHNLKNITRLTQSTPECLECPIAQGCAYCTAYNYQELGHFNARTTYTCIMHKARYLANCYFWNQYYEKYGNVANKSGFPLEISDEEALTIIDQDELLLLKELQRKRGIL